MLKKEMCCTLIKTHETKTIFQISCACKIFIAKHANGTLTCHIHTYHTMFIAHVLSATFKIAIQ